MSRAAGERRPSWPRPASHAQAPALTEFRLLWDTLATTLPGRPKLILDPKAAGRRHLWLADPETFSPGAWPRAGAGRSRDPEHRNPTIERKPASPAMSKLRGKWIIMGLLLAVLVALARSIVIVDQTESVLRHRIRPAGAVDRAAGPPFQVASSERPRVRPPAPARHAHRRARC